MKAKELAEEIRDILNEKEDVFTNERMKRWKADLERINKYNSSKKTKIIGIKRISSDQFSILCQDELSMFRVAQYYKKKWKDFGYSPNLKAFYVNHIV